jgi:hypothetical protein
MGRETFRVVLREFLPLRLLEVGGRGNLGPRVREGGREEGREGVMGSE